MLIQLGSDVVEGRASFQPFELIGGQGVLSLYLSYCTIKLSDLQLDLSIRSALEQV
jgi:hypothetical protein